LFRTRGYGGRGQKKQVSGKVREVTGMPAGKKGWKKKGGWGAVVRSFAGTPVGCGKRVLGGPNGGGH